MNFFRDLELFEHISSRYTPLVRFEISFLKMNSLLAAFSFQDFTILPLSFKHFTGQDSKFGCLRGKC